VLDRGRQLIGERSERIRQSRRDLIEALSSPGRVPSIIQVGYAAASSHFSFAPEVTIFHSPSQHTILETRAPRDGWPAGADRSDSAGLDISVAECQDVHPG